MLYFLKLLSLLPLVLVCVCVCVREEGRKVLTRERTEEVGVVLGEADGPALSFCWCWCGVLLPVGGKSSELLFEVGVGVKLEVEVEQRGVEAP